MTSRDFVYWLQGFFELTGKDTTTCPCSKQIGMTADQATMVRSHLALVFKHEIDPAAGSAEHQAALNKIHEALKPDPSRPPTPPVSPHLGPVFRC